MTRVQPAERGWNSRASMQAWPDRLTAGHGVDTYSFVSTSTEQISGCHATNRIDHTVSSA